MAKLAHVTHTGRATVFDSWAAGGLAMWTAYLFRTGDVWFDPHATKILINHPQTLTNDFGYVWLLSDGSVYVPDAS